MVNVTIDQIDERLRQLPPEKLSVVFDFVSYLAERDSGQFAEAFATEAFHAMVASEATLAKDWDRPEEDAAWADL